MAIEREFGRQLREISDEFDREHQGPARRTQSVRASSSSLCLSLFLVFTANFIFADILSNKCRVSELLAYTFTDWTAL